LGGAPHPDGLVKAPLPHYVRQLKQILKQSGLEVGDFVSLDEDSSYNQVLLNEYNDGKGISFHKDGALYHPVALVLSLVSPAVIEFIPQKPERGIDFASQCQVLLEKNSLLIFTDEAYTNLYHGIRDQQQDEILETCLNRKIANVQIGDVIKRGDKRVSLTIRCCAKVSNFSGFSEHQKEEMKRRTAWWIQSINEKE
jgi:alkylated DNA repair protein alkB family protein 6